MHTIEIDFDVFKALTTSRDKEEMTYNDVLRVLLNLPKHSPEAAQRPRTVVSGGWRAKEVLFPDGTDFRAEYKGKSYTGKVDNGALAVGGKRFYSPSSAAVSITGAAVNGWNFWRARLPGQSDWRVIASYRN